MAGYVRNEPDGSVALVIEGEQATLDAFLAELGRAMASHIRKRHVEPAPPTGEFGEPGTPGAFHIRY